MGKTKTTSSCVCGIPLSDFCKTCSENQKSLDRRGSKKSKDKKNKEEPSDNIEKDISDSHEVKNEAKQSKSVKDVEMSKFCVHDIPIKDFCKNCSENQKSLNRKASKLQLEDKINSKEQMDAKMKYDTESLLVKGHQQNLSEKLERPIVTKATTLD